MSRQTFLIICIIGLALGLLLVCSGISSAAQALAAPGSSSASDAILGSVAGANKEPRPVGENVPVAAPIATPIPPWSSYNARRYWLPYHRIIWQLTYSPALDMNDELKRLVSVPVILFVLLTMQILRTLIFGRFEIEIPIWKRLLKWIVMYGATIAVAFCFAFGLWPLVFPVGWTVLDLVRHLGFCRREGIHPIYATPRKKLYELEGWEWPE